MSDRSHVAWLADEDVGGEPVRVGLVCWCPGLGDHDAEDRDKGLWEELRRSDSEAWRLW